MSLLYGYNDDGGSVKLEKPMIKTFETDITISEYGSPKTVKEFNTGIVLLGIVTKGSRSISKEVKVNYDFYDALGNKHISTIHGSGYKLIKDVTHITNIPSCHTCLVSSSISINLMGETIKQTKPSKPIKLTILIQYIELK